MTQATLERLDPKKNILIKGAQMHNLKGIDVAIPRNQFVVVTGLSGSGKSSLAFDTLYAEGQRRYVESLSAYARQFLGRFDKPQVEYIKGLSPAIAIEQKVNTRNPRSTVGTTTEIYDYLKLLFARIGRTYSPISGMEVKRDTVQDVVDFVLNLPEKSKLALISRIRLKEDEKLEKRLDILKQQGFSRLFIDNKPVSIEELLENKVIKLTTEIPLLIDRFMVKNDEENKSRIADSVQTAFYEGDGSCEILDFSAKQVKRHVFSNAFELDGIAFTEPSAHFFAFNNPLGACKRCEGFGSVIGIDEDLVIPDRSKSVYDDAVVCWRGDKMSEWKKDLIYAAEKSNFPIHRPISELTKEEYDLLWNGNRYFKGINRFFQYLEEKSYKIQYRVMMARYRGKTKCPDCKGTRLRKDAQYVKINDSSITDLVLTPIEKLKHFFEEIKLNKHEQQVAKRLLIEINNRINYLCEVGLGYLTLNRQSATLSGGESQRINLATSLGSSLVGSMYILDEPSIGLHPRDTKRLINVLKSLKALGNTLVVVEHEEEIMKAADQLIDLGPLAGSLGGELVFQGTHEELIHSNKSLTAKYLTGKEEIPIPKIRRKSTKQITVHNAAENNLKNIDVSFPLKCMVCVTGVSGSGKSSLVNKILFPALKKRFESYGEQTGRFKELSGDLKAVEAVEYIDQNPIGKSSRSNPVTYVKAYDDIRSLFAKQKLSKIRGYKPGHYSFNTDGGRCDNCKGEGTVTIEMQFMADIELKCEACQGKRFKEEILEVKYRDKNIYDLLEMTVDDAVSFFKEDDKNSTVKKILDKLLPLQEVGLGYVNLGQSSSTLSGGEAQRIKLASFLIKGDRNEKNLFIFDEPTTGLHFHDIRKLLHAFNELLAFGHSLLIIEHDMDVVKCADWVIDLGPEGGEAGGHLVFEGTPEDLCNSKESYTAKFLRDKLPSK